MTAAATHITARILGCGSSGGVPRIGNDWGACDPSDPRNRRSRCALLITGTTEGRPGATRVLIDTGCDLRQQLLDADVGAIDAVFYTHAHADHTHGIDDLRALALSARKRIPVYADLETETRLMSAFSYCFSAPAGSPYPPILITNRLTPGEPVTIAGEGGDITLLPFLQQHGSIHSLGFRIGKFAYSCDLSGIPDQSAPALAGLDVWVLDALRYDPHPSHLNLDQALALVERHRPRRAILTNLHVDLDYAVLEAQTPAHVTPAYDGMDIPFAL